MAFLTGNVGKISSPRNVFDIRKSLFLCNFFNHRKTSFIKQSGSRFNHSMWVSCHSHMEQGSCPTPRTSPLSKLPSEDKKRKTRRISIVLRVVWLLRFVFLFYRKHVKISPLPLHQLHWSSSSSFLLASLFTFGNRLLSKSPFLASLFEAFVMVFMSELGDKSMFATALLATRYSPLLVFVGAMIALTSMTAIACFLGHLMHLLPPIYTHYGSLLLFFFFGIQMIRNSFQRRESNELADAQEMVKGFQTDKSWFLSVLGKIFVLIFTAEWCDRSMLATMALASSHYPAAIITGATIANFLCSGIAVIGATILSSRLSEQKVSFAAGSLFLFFGIKSFIEGPEQN